MSRCLLLTLEYVPYHGGVANYLSGLVTQLRLDGHDICVVGPDAGCDVVVPLLSRFFWPRWVLPLFRILRIVRHQCPDYVMISHVLPMGYVARLLLRVCGVPYVVITHGLDIARPRGRKQKALINILRSASLIICNSRFTQSVARSLSAGASVVVYPGITSIPELDAPREAGHAVLSVGRLVERKGFDVLISAMRYVHKQLPRATLSIVGSGPDRERLQRCADQSDADVRFIGDVDRAALEALYSESDVFALVSRDIDGDVEGFGMVYLEAALHALPSVAGQSGGAPEAVMHEYTGLVVDPHDEQAVAQAIIQLLSSPETAHRYGQQGRERAIDSFLWARTSAPFSQYLLANTPLVSVIIPVFNHDRELARCIASIRKQFYSNIEIIVVDDGSDAPVRVDDDITLIRQDNSGAPAARNRGHEAAHGAYVMFCDADVVMRPNMIRRMVDALESNADASYAFCDFRFGFKRFNTPPRSGDILHHRNYIHTTSLIRYDDFPGFDDSLCKFQDWDLWLTLHARGKYGVRTDSFFSVTQRRGGMSAWLPSFFYRFSKLPRVKQYLDAERIIRDKHGI